MERGEKFFFTGQVKILAKTVWIGYNINAMIDTHGVVSKWS